MGNPGHGASCTNFMVIIQSIDYNKFEKLSSVSDEIFSKLLSSLLNVKCLLQFLIDMILNFELKLLKENATQKTQLIYRKLKLLITEKFRIHFKVTMGIQKWRETYCYTF